MIRDFGFLWRAVGARLVVLTVAVLLLGGCGDGGGDTTSGSGGSSGGGTGSLSISGTPPAQIVAGSAFNYTPTIGNPGGLTLSYSATNLPGWASIDPSSGRITGTPGAGDVATYSNIRITVAGGGTSVTSSPYSITVMAAATGSATVTWLPPTQKSDGSPLTNLAGFRIYYGQSVNDLNQFVTVTNPGITTYVIDNLVPATWYFAATAYDASGVESAFSNLASKTIQ